MRRPGRAGRAGSGAPGGPFGGAVPGGHWAAFASLLAAAGRSWCLPVAHAGEHSCQLWAGSCSSARLRGAE